MVPTPTSPLVIKTPAQKQATMLKSVLSVNQTYVKIMNFKTVCADVGLPITEVKSSGAELPAAMNVAPATSSLS